MTQSQVLTQVARSLAELSRLVELLAADAAPSPSAPTAQPAPKRKQFADSRYFGDGIDAADAAPSPSAPTAGQNPDEEDRVPRTGRQLFAWSRKLDEDEGTDLVRRITSFGKRNRLPAKIVDWSETDVANAFAAVAGR